MDSNYQFSIRNHLLINIIDSEIDSKARQAVPEGHVLAISGPHVVQSDWDWSQIIGFS